MKELAKNCHHQWGDTDFDWKGLDTAGLVIWQFCRMWCGPLLSIKEKYGTLRVNTYFYCYCGNNQYIGAICETIAITYQKLIYKLAYKKALRMFPHLKHEILVDCDYPEVIGSEAVEIVNLYWSTTTKG